MDDVMLYEVRRRPWPARFAMARGLLRPWELVALATGLPIGFYETVEAAVAASPDAERTARPAFDDSADASDTIEG